MTSQFDADNNLWNGVSGYKDDCHVRCKSLPTSPNIKEIQMIYTYETKPGKRTCKYYKTCGNAENCKRCQSFEKEKK